MINGPTGPKKEEVPIPTLEQFKPRFIESYCIANRQKPSSVDHKEKYLRLYVLPLLGKRCLDEIHNEDVQRLKAVFEKKSAKTANNALTVLGKMLRVAVEWGILKEMPCTVRLLKTKHVEMEFYEEEDFERLVAGAAQADDRALIAMLLGGDAGLRSGEMTALEWTDIDFRRNQLHVNRAQWEEHVDTPKGGRSRTIPMTDRLAAALKEHRHLKGPRVFYSDDGSVADRDALASWIRRAERRAGLRVTGRLHILRHTFCSRLAMRGAAAKESAIALLNAPPAGGERGESSPPN
jgi:integrase